MFLSRSSLGATDERLDPSLFLALEVAIAADIGIDLRFRFLLSPLAHLLRLRGTELHSDERLEVRIGPWPLGGWMSHDLCLNSRVLPKYKTKYRVSPGSAKSFLNSSVLPRYYSDRYAETELLSRSWAVTHPEVEQGTPRLEGPLLSDYSAYPSERSASRSCWLGSLGLRATSSAIQASRSARSGAAAMWSGW